MVTCSNAACRETRWRGGDLTNHSKHFDPNGGVVFNASKETTTKEVNRVRGVSEYTQRMQGINLSGGRTNSMEWCQTMLKLPGLDKMLAAFQKHLKEHKV